jgi:hypothetical protein
MTLHQRMWRHSGWNHYEVHPAPPCFRLSDTDGILVLHTKQYVDIEKSLGVATPPLLSEHPSSTLYEAAKLLIQTHARRLPLLDHDTATGHEVIVSVLTQYRLLKFISINVCVYPSANNQSSALTTRFAVHQGNFTTKSTIEEIWYLNLCLIQPTKGRPSILADSHSHTDDPRL